MGHVLAGNGTLQRPSIAIGGPWRSREMMSMMAAA